MEQIHPLIEKVEMDIREGKPDDEIFQSLSPLLGKSPTEDTRFFEGLATLPHPKTARLLQRLLEISDQKKAKKVIKRSLYRLKGRGIVPEEVSTLMRGESILRPLQTEPTEGFASGIDFLGKRILMLKIPHPGRRWTVMEGLVSDREGLETFYGYEMTPREFRVFLEELRQEIPFPLAETEPSYVGFLFHEAYEIRVKKGGAIPREYPPLKGEIERIKKDYEKPLIYSYIRTDEMMGDDRLLGRSGDLLKIDILKSWRIEEDQIRSYADALWEAEESRIILNRTQKEARFHEIYQKALTDLFSGERRLLYKRRLEETAYLLFKLGKEEEAKCSLATALDLERPPHPFQPNPFLFHLVVKSIFHVLNKDKADDEEKEGPSLIVKP